MQLWAHEFPVANISGYFLTNTQADEAGPSFTFSYACSTMTAIPSSDAPIGAAKKSNHFIYQKASALWDHLGI